MKLYVAAFASSSGIRRRGSPSWPGILFRGGHAGVGQWAQRNGVVSWKMLGNVAR